MLVTLACATLVLFGGESLSPSSEYTQHIESAHRISRIRTPNGAVVVLSEYRFVLIYGDARFFSGAFLAVWGCFQWKRARKIGAMRAAGRAERTVDPEADAAEASLELR